MDTDYALCHAGTEVLSITCIHAPTPRAAPSKALICGRLLSEIVGSNPTGGHRYLSLMSVVCRQVAVPATGRSIIQRSRTECGVSECDREASIMRRPRPTRTSSHRLERETYVTLEFK